MRTSPYDQDLRNKVIECIESGNTQKLAAETFLVSIASVKRWYKSYRELGHCRAKKHPGAKRKIDREELAKYFTEHPDARLIDAANIFHVSVVSIHYCLRTLGFRYKKNIWLSRKK